LADVDGPFTKESEMATKTAKKTTKKAATKKATTSKRTSAKVGAGKKAATKPTAKAAATTPAKKEKTPKAMSGLDAAAAILAASKDPLNVKAIVEQAEAKGLWKSRTGKTPAATISAAIGREIVAKGKDSRFKKTDRGLFAATGKGA
jgi:hypothetical protein